MLTLALLLAVLAILLPLPGDLEADGDDFTRW